MTNRRRVAAAVATACAVLVTARANAADTSHDVTVGGVAATTATPFSAATPQIGFNARFSVRMSTGQVVMWNCSSSTASGHVQSGVDVMVVTGSSWTGCTFILGSYTVTHPSPWTFHSPGHFTSAAETVQGHVDDIVLSFANTANPAICHFRIEGSADAGFDETTQGLSVAETGLTGDLHLAGVLGCGGQLHDGDPVDLSVSWTVSASGGAVNIVS